MAKKFLVVEDDRQVECEEVYDETRGEFQLVSEGGEVLRRWKAGEPPPYIDPVVWKRLCEMHSRDPEGAKREFMKWYRKYLGIGR